MHLVVDEHELIDIGDKNDIMALGVPSSPFISAKSQKTILETPAFDCEAPKPDLLLRKAMLALTQARKESYHIRPAIPY